MNLILKWLLHHLMFAGTAFFAAGAVALGAPEGSNVETTIEGGTDGIDDGSGQSADSLSSGVQEGDQEAAQAARDQRPTTHRAVLDNFRKSEEFKQLKPEVAKAITKLQQTLASVSQSLSAVGGLKAIPQLAEAISRAGGVEALTEMQSRIAEIDEVDSLLEAGDPKYVDNIAENMPDQFMAMMPHAIEKWAEADEEGFTRFIAQNVVGALFNEDPSSPGIASLLSRAFTLIGENKGEDAKKIISGIYNWCKGIRQQAQGRAGQKTPNAAEKRLSDQRKQFEKDQAEAFNRDTGAKAAEYWLQKIRSEMKRHFGNRPLSEDTMTDLVRGVSNEMDSICAKDKDYQRSIEQARKSKNAERIISLAKQFADSKIPGAVKAVFQRRYRGMSIPQQVKRTAPVQQQQKSGVKTPAVTKATIIPVKPKDSQLARSLTSEQERILKDLGFPSLQRAIMNNVAFTTSGKLVQWQKDF